MMERQLSAIACIFALCAIGSVVSQQTRCSLMMRYGGYCVSKKQGCPAGTTEYPYYSNYMGCFRVDQSCCAVNRGPVINPNGVEPPVTQTCGVGSLEPSSRILDGLLTGVCDWPFVVSIRAQLAVSPSLTLEGTSHACQGVIVANQWVLTSPFCIFSAAESAEAAPSRILVVAGEYNTSGIDIDPVTGEAQEQVINVDQVFIHPNYTYRQRDDIIPFDNPYEINSDALALIKLAEPINGRCSGVACLPTADEAANDCDAYDDCIITGWGFSTEGFENGLRDELLFGRVQLSSRKACDFLTSRLNLQSSRSRGTICQSPRFQNTDSCLGDEGGAVMCSNGYNWVVRGILPFNMCSTGQYNLFVTDVAPYLNWIHSTIASGSSSQTMFG